MHYAMLSQTVELDSLRTSMSSHLDTISTRALDLADARYIEVLEKTNQQLNMWLNPYGLMVAALGVLFAILAVVAAVIIWRQGKEYRRVVDEAILRYQKVLDGILAERVNEMREALDKEIEEQKNRLDTIAERQRASAEERLRELEQQRDALPNTYYPGGPPDALLGTPVYGISLPVTGLAPPGEKSVTCEKCSQQYTVNTWLYTGLSAVGTQVPTKCPTCGAINYVLRY